MTARVDILALDRAMTGLLESALMPEAWPQTLEAISRATGSMGAHIMPTRGRFNPGFLTTPNLLDAFQVYFEEDWHLRDFRDRGIGAVLAKGAAIEHDIASENEFRHSEYYNEFLGRFGLRYSAIIGFMSDDTLLSLNLQRTAKDQPFDCEEERILVRMQSKLTASAEIIRSLQTARIEGMSEAFEMAAVACIFFDRWGRVTRLNNRAEKLLDQEIRIKDRELTASRSEETAMFRRHLRSVLSKAPFVDTAVSTPVFFTRRGKQPLVIRAQYLDGLPAEIFSHSVAVATITDLSERIIPNVSLLRRMFSLTQQEATVTRLLVEGLSPREIAEACGLQYETARGYVKRVLAKTGTQRQAQLISLLASLKL